ncbi:hypothetical protein OTU49_003319 [Cherax quadricarinatus]|uniref:Uncharacterized protein n=1 Tax=Cherax quadricarinatus TaxID=27406 RepID=A0AAW0X673_CHEQU|nr:membrane progestin receptor gamma-like [Cherax quadricarinatus]
MFPNVGYVTGRLREARNVTGRLREVGRIHVKRVEEVSEPLREPGIITGYRHENCSVIQAVASLFNATNETVNFWTHFVASVYFAWLLVSLSTIMPLFEDPYLFPLTCYMIAACCYPLMSCLAHAFSCLSLTATHICFFIDYLAIAMYSWAVAYLYYSYCFPPNLMNSWFSQIYLPVAAVNAVLATLCASLSRFIIHPGFQKTLRVAAFVEPFVWDSFPLVVWLYTCDTSTESCGESRIYHLNQFFCVITASFFYGSHIPERLAPGCFDYVGHSHNILHIFSIMGTNEQMRAVLIDLKNRREGLEKENWLPTPMWALQATPSLLMCNIFLVLLLTYYLSKHMRSVHQTCPQNSSRQPLVTATIVPSSHTKDQ